MYFDSVFLRGAEEWEDCVDRGSQELSIMSSLSLEMLVWILWGNVHMKLLPLCPRRGQIWTLVHCESPGNLSDLPRSRGALNPNLEEVCVGATYQPCISSIGMTRQKRQGLFKVTLSSIW